MASARYSAPLLQYIDHNYLLIDCSLAFRRPPAQIQNGCPAPTVMPCITMGILAVCCVEHRGRGDPPGPLLLCRVLNTGAEHSDLFLEIGWAFFCSLVPRR